jgi:hypothetical protein
VKRKKKKDLEIKKELKNKDGKEKNLKYQD